MGYYKKTDDLLFEAYIKSLTLKEGQYSGDENQLAADYAKMVMGDYSKFIEWLKMYADDSRLANVILTGNKDGDPVDDAFKAETVDIPVQKLKPTQKEIGIPDSLEYPLKKNPEAIRGLLSNTPFVVIKNGKSDPIITLNGSYVLDGHHRWSQVYAINPDAKITAINLVNPKVTPVQALKGVQAAVAALRGQVPEKGASGDNLLTIDLAKLKQITLSLLSEEALKIAIELKYCTDKNSFADIVVKNVSLMRQTSQPAQGAPPRTDMPQPGEAKPTPLVVNDPDITSGKVNFVPPIVSVPQT